MKERRDRVKQKIADLQSLDVLYRLKSSESNGQSSFDLSRQISKEVD